jgi:transposase
LLRSHERHLRPLAGFCHTPEHKRRARRTKTDGLDLAGLLNLLTRYVQGDRRVWRVVRVPTVAEEDTRQLPRALESLTQDRTRVFNRLKGLLATHGVALRIDEDFLNQLNAARLWDGTPCRRDCNSDSPAIGCSCE